MAKNIDKLKDHYILCGAGMVGLYIIEEFTKSRQSFVVIEQDPENIKKLPADVLWVEGDASDDAIMQKVRDGAK